MGVPLAVNDRSINKLFAHPDSAADAKLFAAVIATTEPKFDHARLAAIRQQATQVLAVSDKKQTC